MSVLPSEACLLQVRNLSVSLDDGTRIVDDINFSVQSGKILGVVGESGSGKTSIATALLGDARDGAVISSGAVLIGGRNILDLGAVELRHVRGAVVSHVAQDPALALNPMVRICDLLDEMLFTHAPELGKSERQRRIREATSEVGLTVTPEFLRRFPHQLSGGQQQRVLLALAVLLKPRVIVLDEPTTALDVTTQARVLETLRDLSRHRGIGAVYVSHDLAVVSELVDDIMVLYAGRIVERGTREQILSNPLHPYTRALLEAAPDIDGEHAVRPIPGHAPALRERPAGCEFAPRCARSSERCSRKPELKDIGADHSISCHHAMATPWLAERQERPAPMRRAAAALATLSSVSAHYGHNPVLSDVDLELPRGRCTALIGESGSGKTTLARSLVGLVEGARGSFVYDGRPIVLHGSRSREFRRKVQYVFQNPYRALNPKQTIGDILRTAVHHFFSIEGAEAEREIASSLTRVALPPEIARRHPRDLSGGERQRVAVARALICRPELLICDEITSALDVSVQAAIIDLLRRLQQEASLTILFVTHDLGVVRAVADFVAVLQNGEIVEHGSVHTVLENPGHAYTQSLVANSPRFRR